ncbi:TfoX/Sxy family protein [Christensenellaceae bacterium OttesenSCG-928-M15]|nr:TfoX/Sxy family protein [Christensenellaceae bacterium OttesenSCG-928-M15]
MDLAAMKNIGIEMKKKLNAIGIHSAEELSALGSKDAFFRLKTAYPEVCLVHLYTLQGAIDNLDFNMLPEDTKAELKAFSESLK